MAEVHDVVLRGVLLFSLVFGTSTWLRCRDADEELNEAWIEEERSGVDPGRYIPCNLTLRHQVFDEISVKHWSFETPVLLAPRGHTRPHPAVACMSSSPIAVKGVMGNRGRPQSVDARSDSIDI